METNASNLRILIIEDSASDAELIARELRRASFEFNYRRVDDRESLIAALSESDWDLVLSDYNIPGFGALEALELVKEKTELVPFVLVTGAIGEDAAVEAMKSGVDDFVMKSKLARLPIVVRRSLREGQTRRDEIEARNLAEEAVRSRTEMLSVVSHDIRSPVGSIRLSAESALRMLKNTALSSERREQNLIQSMERIQRSTDKIIHLIEDILDRGKIESGRFKIEATKNVAQDLARDCFEVFQPLAAQKGVRLDLALPSDALEVLMDRDRMFQALSNFLGNALKFTPTGGVITVEVKREDSLIGFWVRDTGAGIASEKVSRIFKKFWQADAQASGVGLGLWIAKGVVESHGGRVVVESEVGKGSSFGALIPGMVERKAHRSVSKTCPSILMVDDDIDLRELMAEVLTEHGYAVTAAATAQEGLSLLRDGEEPDLILLDFHMPLMTGAEFVKQMASHHDHIPLILMSGEEDVAIKASTLGARSYLKKPPTVEAVLSEVRAVLGKN